ncbi:hypothetical protein FHS95_002377 [Sphingomonas naasensis]|nr:hypothetical protein [Sphingomonas naasensis]
MKIMLWGPNDEMLMLEPVADNLYQSRPGGWIFSR